MSAFDEAFRIVHAPQMAHFGERVRLTPIVPKVNGRSRYVVGGVDFSRRIRELTAIFSGDPLAAKVAGAGANSRENADIMTARYAVSFDLRDFLGGDEPQKGDLITVLGRPGSPVFKIVAVEPDGVSEIVCRLAECASEDTL